MNIENINNNVSNSRLLKINAELNEIAELLLKQNKMNGLELYTRIDSLSHISSFPDFLFTKALAIDYFFKKFENNHQVYLDKLISNWQNETQ